MPPDAHRSMLRRYPEVVLARVRLLAGISIGWVALSVIGDVFPALVVPARMAETGSGTGLATMVGLVTFAGLLAGMLVQPLFGALSDRSRARWGRRGLLVLGGGLLCGALVSFSLARDVAGIAIAFMCVACAASAMQAAQQG